MRVVVTPELVPHVRVFTASVHQAVSEALDRFVAQTGVRPSAIVIETVDLTGDARSVDSGSVVIGGIRLRFDR